MPQITTYNVDAAKRRLLTPQNLLELGITPSLVQSILAANLPALQRVVVDDKGLAVFDNGRYVQIWPDGLSINETIFCNYSGPTAAAQGWMAYLEIGAPLVEERSDIIQPQADVLSNRTYENRASTGTDRKFSDTIEFTIGNTISWSLEGTSNFTFEGSISSELQSQLSRSLEHSLAKSLEMSQGLSKSSAVQGSKTHTDILKSEYAETQDAVQTGTTDTNTTTTTGKESGTGTGMENFTGTGTATGTGELSAQLMLGITGSVNGTLTTSWGSSSTVSGDIPAGHSVETMATQRRQVKQYTYELPITFGGFVALHYAKLVLPFDEPHSPQPPSILTGSANLVAREINNLGLVKTGSFYRTKGVAETVSTLNVNHIIFENKPIIPDITQTFGTNRPHNL